MQLLLCTLKIEFGYAESQKFKVRKPKEISAFLLKLFVFFKRLYYINDIIKNEYEKNINDSKNDLHENSFEVQKNGSKED